MFSISAEWHYLISTASSLMLTNREGKNWYLYDKQQKQTWISGNLRFADVSFSFMFAEKNNNSSKKTALLQMIVRDIQPNFLLNAEILFRSEKISERVQEWKKNQSW